MHDLTRQEIENELISRGVIRRNNARSYPTETITRLALANNIPLTNNNIITRPKTDEELRNEIRIPNASTAFHYGFNRSLMHSDREELNNLARERNIPVTIDEPEVRPRNTNPTPEYTRRGRQERTASQSENDRRSILPSMDLTQYGTRYGPLVSRRRSAGHQLPQIENPETLLALPERIAEQQQTLNQRITPTVLENRASSVPEHSSEQQRMPSTRHEQQRMTSDTQEGLRRFGERQNRIHQDQDEGLNSYNPTREYENPFIYSNTSDTQRRIENMENALEGPSTESIPSTEAEQRKIMELAFHNYYSPYHQYKGNPVAELAPLQKKSRSLLEKSSPYSNRAEREHLSYKEALTPFLTEKISSEASNPYIERMSENPARYHRELMGDTEREHLDSIRNEAQEMFNQDILPGIRAKYQIPGLRQHGHMARDINQASEKFGKGVASNISKAKLDMLGKTLGVSQNHAETLGKAAQLKSKAAEKDRANQLEAFSTLKQFNQEQEARKNKHTAALNVLGVSDAARTQDRINAQKERYNEARNAPEEKLGRLSNIQKGFQHTSLIEPAKRVQSTAGEMEKTLGSALLGQAGHQFGFTQNSQQAHKKGGRIKKDFGGIVNPSETAIQNSIVQKSDPIYELRRLMNLPDPVQQYATGGIVNPIQAGAQEAQQYVGHSAMKKKLERMRQPVENPGMMGHFMAGAGAMGNNKGWLADSLRSLHAGYSSAKAEQNAGKQRIDSADDLEYQLMNDVEEKKREERKMALQEKVANAQVDKYNHQARESSLKEHKPKITNHNIDEIKRAREGLSALDSADIAVDEAYNSLAKVPTGAKHGAVISKTPLGAGPGLVSLYENIFGGSNKEDITTQKYEDANAQSKAALEAVIQSYKMSNKHRMTNEELQKIEQAKLSPDLTENQNKLTRDKIINTNRVKKINLIKSMIDNNASEEDIISEMQMYGITPEDLNTNIRNNLSSKDADNYLEQNSNKAPISNIAPIDKISPRTKLELLEEARRKAS